MFFKIVKRCLIIDKRETQSHYKIGVFLFFLCCLYIPPETLHCASVVSILRAGKNIFSIHLFFIKIFLSNYLYCDNNLPAVSVAHKLMNQNGSHVIDWIIFILSQIFVCEVSIVGINHNFHQWLSRSLHTLL